MRPYSKTSDTLSEVSEASTSETRTSCYSSDYRDELQDLATSLGLQSHEELHRDRFRVDRKKLESMLLGKSENANSAHQFFQKIMNDTNTLILWPSRLKIGAKSKKDPHIKIAGIVVNVNLAKQKVMAVLDNRSNRVTMKMDVSYTDHSHIIGKGGLRIKRVMEDTHCHIHFPDSNRNNQEEKSNQVSVAGEISAIEKARARVRELTPLIFCFELPNMGTMQSFPELTSPFIVSVQESYNVQVMFRTRAKLHSTLVMVKGCDWEMEKVQEATVHLINHMCEAFANQVSVQMMLEISPQYHGLVLGMGHQNLKTIMQQTGVQVMFPDASDPNTPSLKKSSVSITGSINNVYLARQMLIGSLPLVLMFDVMPEVLSVDSAFLEETMKSLDVYISLRHKPKQNIYSVVIKGLERNATNIYEARRRIIGSKEKAILANIPSTYQVSGNVPTFLKSFSVGSQFHGLSGSMLGNTNGRSNILSPQGINPLLAISNDLRLGLQSIMNSPTNKGLTDKSQQLHQTAMAAAMLQQRFPRHNNQRSPEVIKTPVNHYPAYNGFSGISEAQYSSLSSTTSSLSSPGASPRTTSPSQGFETPKIADTNELQERRAPGFERSVGNFGYMDYQQLRLHATQAMQGIPSRTELRIPTATWSGYGFSHSSPSSVFQEAKKEDLTSNNTDDDNISDGIKRLDEGNGDNSLGFSASSYLDSTSNCTTNVVTSSNYSDLPSQLTSLGLEKYIQLFKSHEIDLATFQTLTEADLKEIGVNALGARRKMLLFITELRRRDQYVFRGSAAPGAERKMNSTNSSPRNDNNNSYW